MPDFESRDFSSAWRNIQSNKCHNCGKRVPNDAEFGKGKHGVVVGKALEIWCDKCYDEQIKEIKEQDEKTMITWKKKVIKEKHELSDSEREKLK